MSPQMMSTPMNSVARINRIPSVMRHWAQPGWRKLPWLLLAGFGLWQLGQGVYIQAKAHLAQYLIEQAWDQTLAGEQQVRPWPWADTWPVARLSVPAKGKEWLVLAGASGRNLAFGPAHVESSAQPGENGNSVIGGHRDTHFQFLQQLAVGDEVFVQTEDGRQHGFVVQGHEVVDSRTSELQLEADSPYLSLVTCYPFDALVAGGPLRYVVTAQALEI